MDSRSTGPCPGLVHREMVAGMITADAPPPCPKCGTTQVSRDERHLCLVCNPGEYENQVRHMEAMKKTRQQDPGREGMKTAEEWGSCIPLAHLKIHGPECVACGIVEIIRRAQEEASAEEREACIRIALSQNYYPDTSVGKRQQWVKERIAAAIRSRGKEEDDGA